MPASIRALPKARFTSVGTWLQKGVNSITALALTQQCLIIGSANGTISWFDLARQDIVAAIDLSKAEICSITLNHGLIIGANDGTINTLPSTPPISEPPQIVQLLNYHSKPISGIACLPGLPLLISISSDGTMRSWNWIKNTTGPVLSTPQQYSSHLPLLRHPYQHRRDRFHSWHTSRILHN